MMEDSGDCGTCDDDNNETELSNSSPQQDVGADQLRSTKWPISKGKQSASKCAKSVKKENPEDILLKKAIQCMERNTDNALQKNDADDVFGQYIATELKGVQDINQKRIIKHRIQSVLLTALVPGTSDPHFSYPNSSLPWQAPFHSFSSPGKSWRSSPSPTPSDFSHVSGSSISCTQPPSAASNSAVSDK